ncbi:MAG: MFS transporter [Sphingomonas sp.]
MWSWRAAFVVSGSLALVWVVLWLVYYRPPAIHPALSEGERDHILGGQEAHTQAADAPPSILSILRRRNFWGIAIPRFLADPTWGTLTFWLPLYLTTVRHFDLGQIALFAFLPFAAADAGCLFGPAVVLALQKRGIGLIDARRWTFTLGALMMTGIMFVGTVQSAYLAVALLCLGGFAHQTLSVTCITMATDLFRRNELGTVAGMAGTLANSGILVFSLAMGQLVRTIGYDPFFVALGAARPDRSGGAVDIGARAGRKGGMIRNPILPGFNPDPSICRVGEDYYIATSTFEWVPGVQIHHSRDPRRLAPHHAPPAPREPARPARRSRQLRRLGAVPQPRRRAPST